MFSVFLYGVLLVNLIIIGGLAIGYIKFKNYNKNGRSK